MNSTVIRWSSARLIGTLAACALVWLILAGACLLVGSTGSIGLPLHLEVFWLRLEVVLVASLVGAALAASGVVYQAILRNPLADPYLLGVSSGATLAAYLWQLPLASVAVVPHVLGQQAAAFVGAAIAVAIVLLLSTRHGRLEPVTLLLVGVIVNAVNGSIFLLINSIVKDNALPGGPISFLVGGIQTNLKSAQEWVAFGTISVSFVVLLFIAGQLNVAMVSEAEAESLGVRIQRLRWLGLIVASMVAASAVSISGPIGFCGLVCPHLARLVVGNDQRRLLPLSTALGAGLLACADGLSRQLSQHIGTVLPVGVLTGLLGGPYFLMLLWRGRRSHAQA